MTKNREPEKVVESSESEEDDEASSEEGSDSEPELTQVTNKSSSAPPAVKKAQPQQQPSPSSDEEESGSESESDSDGPDSNVKPIATKPMDEPQKTSAGARKPKSKSISSELVTPARSTAGKRPAEEKETEETDAKKAKKKSEPESSNVKSNDDSKKLFQRIWSEDDEIVILKGMIDYATKKKSDPVADLSAFHDFIKKSLHVDVTRTQLQDKIRRLRKKYANNKNKEKEGKDRTFSNPHEQRAYELSKTIWGKENGSEKTVGGPKANGSAVKKTPTKKAKANGAEVEEEVKDVQSMEVAVHGVAEGVPLASRPNFNGGGVEENILRIGAELFAAGQGTEAEKEWNKLKLEEMEVFQRQLQLRTAQVKLVLDYLKSTDH